MFAGNRLPKLVTDEDQYAEVCRNLIKESDEPNGPPIGLNLGGDEPEGSWPGAAKAISKLGWGGPLEAEIHEVEDEHNV